MMELVCREVVELVSDYLGHSLAPEEQVRFEKHLLTCAPCTAYLAQMRAVVALTGGLRAAGQPGAAVEVFRRWRRSGR
jgi:anti-sigma factor RsiW